MLLMILGAGKLQINAIKRAQEMGLEVLAVDYYYNSPGKEIADYKGFASTFDVEACLELGKQYKIDAIMTTGTDQPVYTAAVIAEKLDLPFYLNPNTAYNVTNKKAMKRIFKSNNIPTVNWRLINKTEELNDFNLTFPVVLKPVDSQGQRGIYLVNSIDELLKKRSKVFEYSRDTEILAEEFYPNKEVTISGWVKEGKVIPLTISDRVTFNDTNKLGICVSHEYPTINLENYGEKIIELTEKIVKVFRIENGPIYFQMLVGKEGVKVNEIACRIGGAYEDFWIPHLTGIDILEMNINYCLGKEYASTNLFKWSHPKKFKDSKCLSVQLFFSEKGEIYEQTDFDLLKQLQSLFYVDYNFKIGDVLKPIENASQRAGVFIVEGKDENEIENRINMVYNHMKFININNENMIIRGERGNRNE